MAEVTPDEVWECYKTWLNCRDLTWSTFYQLTNVYAFAHVNQTVSEEAAKRVRGIGGPHGYALLRAYLARDQDGTDQKQ